MSAEDLRSSGFFKLSSCLFEGGEDEAEAADLELRDLELRLCGLCRSLESCEVSCLAFLATGSCNK